MFNTHNEHHIDVNGTSLQGYVECRFSHLVQTFGKPSIGDAYKTDAEWEIEWPDGAVATIYNWKDGYNYNGQSGQAVDDITEWHVGGHTPEIVDRVKLELRIGVQL